MAFQWHPLLNTPWKETMESEYTKTYLLEFELMRNVLNVNQYCSFSSPPPLSLDWDWLNANGFFAHFAKRAIYILKSYMYIYMYTSHKYAYTYITHAHNWFFDPWIRQTTEDVCCRWHSLPHNHRFLCL